MRFRPIHNLVLLAIVYWTSGAALFLHEQMEHSQPDGANVVAVADSGRAGALPAGENSKHHHDDHDDCPICQLLAHMQAEHVVPEVVVCGLLPSFTTPHIADRLPPAVDSDSFTPIRGPPVVAGHFIV
jgi:hypothetical protein